MAIETKKVDFNQLKDSGFETLANGFGMVNSLFKTGKTALEGTGEVVTRWANREALRTKVDSNDTSKKKYETIYQAELDIYQEETLARLEELKAESNTKAPTAEEFKALQDKLDKTEQELKDHKAH